MGILPGLFSAVLNLICIGIDITVFFVLCRIVLMWRKIHWLERLNDIGKGLVDALAVYTGQLWYKATKKHLSIKGELLISLASLLFVRVALSQLGGLFLNPGHTNMKTSVIHKFEEESQTSEAICLHLRILGHKGFGVTELRIFNPMPAVAYADSEDDAVRLVLEMEGKTSGIYVGVQPRSLHLFDFAPNCWVPARSKPHTNCATDNDIEYITVCFWDLDVVSEERSKGHPASDEELQQSLHVAQLLSQEDDLTISSTICCSGNGHYVLAPVFPISVYSNEEAAKFKQFCQQIARKVTGHVKRVKIDPVYNLSRVMRIMGTVNGKGQAIEGRPHRRAYFVTEPIPEARSMSLHYKIRNSEVVESCNTTGPLPRGLRCDLQKLENCRFLQWCRTHPEQVSEPAWWAMITNLAHLEGGIDLIHEISRLDPVRYDFADTQYKIQKAIDVGYRPVSCKTIVSEAMSCPGRGKFNCSKISQCPAKAPMYLATLRTVYKR